MRSKWKRAAAACLAAALVACSLPAVTAVDKPVSVMLNGQAMSFMDGAHPVIRGGRTYVPFRTIFEGMGAQVGWDAATKTVSAERNGAKVQFVVGKPVITITEQGKTRTLQADAPPFLSEGRTLVPVRFAAQAFGANVGWDAAAHTVLIVDVEKLRQGQSETYRVMDRYLAFTNPIGVHAVNGNVSISLVLSGGIHVPININFYGLQSGDGGNLTIHFQAETTQLSSALAADKNAVDSGLAKLLLEQSGKRYECIYQLNDDSLYLNSDALTGENIPAGAWVRLSLDKTLGLLTNGEGNTAMLRAKAAHHYADYVAGMAQGLKLTAASADNLSAVLAVFKDQSARYGDSVFVQQGNSLQVSTGTAEDGASDMLQLKMSGDQIVEAEQYAALAQNGQLVYQKSEIWRADGTSAFTLVIGAERYQAEVSGEVIRTPSGQSMVSKPTGKIVPES